MDIVLRRPQQFSVERAGSGVREAPIRQLVRYLSDFCALVGIDEWVARHQTPSAEQRIWNLFIAEQTKLRIEWTADCPLDVEAREVVERFFAEFVFVPPFHVALFDGFSKLLAAPRTLLPDVVALMRFSLSARAAPPDAQLTAALRLQHPRPYEIDILPASALSRAPPSSFMQQEPRTILRAPIEFRAPGGLALIAPLLIDPSNRIVATHFRATSAASAGPAAAQQALQAPTMLAHKCQLPADVLDPRPDGAPLAHSVLEYLLSLTPAQLTHALAPAHVPQAVPAALAASAAPASALSGSAAN
jgi:hypothetical protein